MEFAMSGLSDSVMKTIGLGGALSQETADQIRALNR